MTVKIEIKSVLGKLLFEFEKENNSIKETLNEARLHGANLEGANLVGAYLREAYLVGAYLREAYLEGANLVGANLQGANLQGANLHGANLEGANLQRANLHGANLREANLHGANLQRANLRGANLQGANIPIFSKWGFSIRDDNFLKIGCKEKTFDEWVIWFKSGAGYDTKRGTEEFRQIEAMFLAHKAYHEHIKHK